MKKILLFVMVTVFALSLVSPAVSAEIVEIEYGGKIISVDMADIILTSGTDGDIQTELNDPAKYSKQIAEAPVYGESRGVVVTKDDEWVDAPESFNNQPQASNTQEITARQYEDEKRARRWTNIVENLTVRDIDSKALELVKEFSEAKGAVPPSSGAAGSVVIVYSSYTLKIVCRPMYVTDVILQPGEKITGVHPGDAVRRTFVPGRSGNGEGEQLHVLIKPLMADISTNLVINTDRRTYQLDLMAQSAKFMPSVSFSYPADTLKAWDTFIADRKKDSEGNLTIASGYSVKPEDLHLDYEVRGKDSLRWKPIRVWDDGVKTYIRFSKGSVRKSVEAPVLVVFEHKKEVLVNYRAAEDMYIVDRVFDKGALIAGTGSLQDRVVITRLRGK
ncbi:hypothetical protein FACS1894216_21840 [Synergistales bacterium]|nr:hypothetical protein FACS1894216_21840 [Synergistales bacterium]